MKLCSIARRCELKCSRCWCNATKAVQRFCKHCSGPAIISALNVRAQQSFLQTLLGPGNHFCTQFPGPAIISALNVRARQSFLQTLLGPGNHFCTQCPGPAIISANTARARQSFLHSMSGPGNHFCKHCSGPAIISAHTVRARQSFLLSWLTRFLCVSEPPPRASKTPCIPSTYTSKFRIQENFDKRDEKSADNLPA
jgi:hypothetical protein